jgi:hypothetical protein
LLFFQSGIVVYRWQLTAPFISDEMHARSASYVYNIYTETYTHTKIHTRIHIQHLSTYEPMT